MLPRLLCLGFLCLLGTGCALDNASKRMARVNDRVGGFKIAAVDGQPPVRWHHSLHSVLPVVLVEPGQHRFTTEDGQEITADVQTGQYYETSKAGAAPELLDNDKLRNKKQLREGEAVIGNF
jgi:hypothetical protein